MNIEALATKWDEAADAIFAESKYDIHRKIQSASSLLRIRRKMCIPI